MKGDKEIVCGSPSFALIGDDERDAARYRWLRANPERALQVYMEWEGWQHEFRTPERFDQDVDAAMKK